MDYQPEPLQQSACERIRTLLPAYLDGALTEIQRTEIEKHLAVCPACTQRHALLCSLPEALSETLPTPSSALHESIMRSVRATPQKARLSRRRTATMLASALCLVLLCAALIMGTPDIPMMQDTPGNHPPTDGATSDSAPPLDKDEAEDSETDGGVQETPNKPGNSGGNSPFLPDNESSVAPEGDGDAPGNDPQDPPASDSDQSENTDSSLFLPMDTTLVFHRKSDKYWVCLEYGYLLLFPDDDEFILVDNSNRFATGQYTKFNSTSVEIIEKKTYDGSLYYKDENTLHLIVYTCR